MKFRKRMILIICLIVLSWVFYKFVTLPTYSDDGKTITYKNNIYVEAQNYDFTGTDNIGKVIGIAIYGDRKKRFGDLMFGTTIREFKNDKDHDFIYIRWAMGPEAVFKRVSK